MEKRLAEQRAEHPAVGDRECSPLEVLEGESAVDRALREITNRELELRERPPVGVANHRHDEPALGSHRHADVEVVLVDDLVSLYFGIELRKRAQGGNAGLDEE